jgi:tetratricopeptide (TPR) repeat protein
MGTPETPSEVASNGLPAPTQTTTGSNARHEGNVRWRLSLLLVALTFLAYQPARHAGFIWDDDQHIAKNTLLTAPHGFKLIWFSPPRNDSYFPMVNTTLRFEHALWGLNPSGYHCVNILLHSLNALLVWAVLRRLALPGAWLGAAIWALHPVNVESVAWITELKNTQSTLFYMLTLLAWMKFTEGGTVHRWRYYVLALLLYGPALFTKTTTCTLPAAMLLVLWLRNQRIDWRRLCQIMPFVCYAIVTGLLTVWCEVYLGGYREAVRHAPGGMQRLLIAAHALWFYAAKLAWPTNLTFSYPHWEISLRDPLQYSWLVACIALPLLLLWRRNAIGRGPITAVIFFVATLSLLLGFIPVYTFRFSFVADHYQYLANIGLIALFAAAASSQADRWQLRRHARWALSACLLVVLGALTWKQAGTYRDAETLWRDTLAENPDSWLAHNNLGLLLEHRGEAVAAEEQYRQALEIDPKDTKARLNLGNALMRQGKAPEAIEQYQEALRIQPDYARAHINLGNVLLLQGDLRDAIGHYEESLRIDPDSAEAHLNLAVALEQAGRASKAVSQYELALRLNPDLTAASNALARLREGQ